MPETVETGVECFECSAVIIGGDPTAPCESCDSDNVGEVEIRPCPDVEKCEDDEHHYGMGKHVRSL